MKIKDYGLVIYLLCRGYNILDYTRDLKGRVWFRFSDDADIRQSDNDFRTNDATVRVQDYLAAQRRIKALIFETNIDEYESEGISAGTPEKVYNPD